MTRKRLIRNQKWGFQSFPYHQMRMDNELFHGLVSVIELTDGEYLHWNLERAGKVAVAGKGMVWLQLIPDDGKRVITAKFLPNKRVSVWYVDVCDSWDYDEDGVAAFMDLYLDVIFTPQGDVKIDDRDELDAAFEAGEITKEQYEGALREGDAIILDLCKDIRETENWCRKVLDCVEAELNRKKFVIFLDIDGVLDVFDPHAKMQYLLPNAVERLHRLVDRTKAEVVVVSDWRYGCKKYWNRCVKGLFHKKESKPWAYLRKTLKKAKVAISDVTPWRDDLKSRTEEIRAYLQEHPEVYNYVILDDCFGDDFSSDPEIQSHLVFVDALKGIDDDDLVKACEIMNRAQDNTIGAVSEIPTAEHKER